MKIKYRNKTVEVVASRGCKDCIFLTNDVDCREEDSERFEAKNNLGSCVNISKTVKYVYEK